MTHTNTETSNGLGAITAAGEALIEIAAHFDLPIKVIKAVDALDTAISAERATEPCPHTENAVCSQCAQTETSNGLVERLRSPMFDQAGELGAAAHEAADRLEHLERALTWQSIETAPKDGSYIIAIYRSLDGYAAHLDGRAFVVRHEGKTASDYDLGWALFPGYGGVPDKCLSQWKPLGLNQSGNK